MSDPSSSEKINEASLDSRAELEKFRTEMEVAWKMKQEHRIVENKFVENIIKQMTDRSSSEKTDEALLDSLRELKEFEKLHSGRNEWKKIMEIQEKRLQERREIQEKEHQERKEIEREHEKRMEIEREHEKRMKKDRKMKLRIENREQLNKALFEIEEMLHYEAKIGEILDEDEGITAGIETIQDCSKLLDKVLSKLDDLDTHTGARILRAVGETHKTLTHRTLLQDCTNQKEKIRMNIKEFKHHLSFDSVSGINQFQLSLLDDTERLKVLICELSQDKEYLDELTEREGSQSIYGKDSSVELDFERLTMKEQTTKVEMSIEPDSPSLPHRFSMVSMENDLSMFQNELDIFCQSVIRICKERFKSLVFTKKDGSKAFTLRHFLKIESEILKFQMKMALETLGDDDVDLGKPTFPNFSPGECKKNKNLITAQLSYMKVTLEETRNNVVNLEGHMREMKKSSDSMVRVTNRTATLAFLMLSLRNSYEDLLSAGIYPISDEREGNLDHSKNIYPTLKMLFIIQSHKCLSQEALDTMFSEDFRKLRDAIEEFKVITLSAEG